MTIYLLVVMLSSSKHGALSYLYAIATITMPRHIKLEGVHNLRDFGGYATRCGRGLRPGLLYRSDAHHGATDADLDAIASLGVATIVDLRHPPEPEREVMRRWPGFGAQVIASDWRETFPSWESVFKGRPPTVELIRERRATWYAQMAFAEGRIEVFSRCFDTLAEGAGPVLIHCSAGKDRTGILVALIQHAAGVDGDDILADFLMTNTVGMYERRWASTAEALRQFGVPSPSDELILTAMAVEPAHLEAAFSAIEDRYGSIDAYLEQALGLAATKRAAFQAHLAGGK